MNSINFHGYWLSRKMVKGAMSLLNCSEKEAKKWLRDKPTSAEIARYRRLNPGLSKQRIIHEIRTKRHVLADLHRNRVAAREASIVTGEMLSAVVGPSSKFGSRVS